jgi:lipoyl(octanoyl) transferase
MTTRWFVNESTDNLIPVKTMPVTGGEVDTVLPGQWEFWRSGADSGVRNMAIDAALLRKAATATGQAVGLWRCYSFARPTVSFGRNESTRGRFDDDSVANAGLDAVRRPTGGRALLHAREVTYSVTMPLAAGLSWQVAYGAVNRLLVASLLGAGFPVAVVGADDGADATRPVSANGAVRPNGPLCFDAPAPGEISARGMKLVASAVWREREAYLQHGSILLHDDQALLVSAAGGRVPVPPPAATLADLVAAGAGIGGLSRVVIDDETIQRDVVNAMERALTAISVVTPFTASASLNADITVFEEQFARRDWLWRR